MKQDDLRKLLDDLVPFNKMLGIHLVEISDGWARMELPFKKEHIGDPMRPALHGGLISTLIDTCGGAAVWGAAEEQDRVSTVDLRVDFLRPGPLETLCCEAKVQRIGNRVAVTDMQVFAKDRPQEIVATGKGVYNVKRADA